MEIPDVAPVTPTLFVVVACYCGPNWFNGNWKVFGPWVSQIRAEEEAKALNKWYRKRKIYRLE